MGLCSLPHSPHPIQCQVPTLEMWNCHHCITGSLTSMHMYAPSHTHTHTHAHACTRMPESLFEAGPRNRSHSRSLREATSPPFSSLPYDYKVTALYKTRLGQITPHHCNLRSCLEPKWSCSQILGLMSLHNYLGTISPRGC